MVNTEETMGPRDSYKATFSKSDKEEALLKKKNRKKVLLPFTIGL